MLTKIYHKIKEYQTIIIHRHSKPDGDALGAQLGLKMSLKLTYPDKDIRVVGDELGRYSWMGNMDEVSDDIYKDALVIVLDSGSEKLISDDRYKLAKFLIKIDHHIPQGDYGDICYTDTSRESCAGIVASFCLDKRLKIDKDIASLFFIGIVSDSGRFRYSSTTSATFQCVSKLLSYDIEIDKIYNKLYLDKLANIKLKAKLVDKFVYLPSGVAYLINTKEDVKNYGLTTYDLSRGMVNIMSGIEEICIWANFTEDTNGDIYCELRSNSKNINKVATKYGGGGHLQASGCTVDSFDTVMKIVSDLEMVAKGE